MDAGWIFMISEGFWMFLFLILGGFSRFLTDLGRIFLLWDGSLIDFLDFPIFLMTVILPWVASDDLFFAMYLVNIIMT